MKVMYSPYGSLSKHYRKKLNHLLLLFLFLSPLLINGQSCGSWSYSKCVATDGNFTITVRGATQFSREPRLFVIVGSSGKGTYDSENCVRVNGRWVCDFNISIPVSRIGGPGTYTFQTTQSPGAMTCARGSFTILDPATDTDGPVLTCPDISVSTSNGSCGANVNYSNFSATDGCSIESLDWNIEPGSYFNVGTSQVSVTATDWVGNQTSCSFNVTVNDNESPSVSCPATINTGVDPGTCEKVLTYDVSATDNCSLKSLKQIEGLPSGSSFPVGTTPIVFVAEDATGRETFCSFNVKVVDDEAPTIACIENITTNIAPGTCEAVVEYSITASDNCTGEVLYQTGGRESGSLFWVGTTTNTYEVRDMAGNTARCTFDVIVVDNENPTITCPPSIDITTDPGSCSIVIDDLGTPVFSDNCPSPTVINDAPSSFSVGSNYVKWTVKDDAGNSSDCLQLVFVNDQQGPVPDVASLPVLKGDCAVSVNSAPTAFDVCDGQTVVGQTDDPLTYSTPGTHTINWAFQDVLGNTTYQTQTLIVENNVAPVPNLSTLPIVSAECSATVSPPTATDACAGIIIATTSDPLTYTTQGTHSITWTYDDGSSNTVTQTQTVVIKDLSKPVPDVSVLPTMTAKCEITINPPTATDECVGGITGTTNDPLTYTEQGTHTITWTYDDGNGNTETQTQTVILEDVAKPVLDLPTLPLVTAECSATVSTPTATDECAGAITGTTNDPLSYTTQGTHIITWIYDDGNGNTEIQTQTVIIEDVTAPTITCPADIIVDNDAGECSAIVDYEVIYDDNCAVGSLNQQLGLASGAAFPVGTTTNSFELTDHVGLMANCSFTVTVNDVEKPTISCSQNISQNTDPGECGAMVSLPKAAPFDNCGIKNIKSRYRSVTEDGSPEGNWSAWANDHSGFFELGFYEIQWRAKDDSNNKGYCEHLLEVKDEEAPQVVCKDLTVAFNGEASIAIPSTHVFDEAASFDACGAVSILSQNINQVECEAVGQTVSVEIIGIDPNGNTSNCTAQVTVVGMPCGLTATDIDCEQGATAEYDPATETFTLSADDCSGYPQGEFSFVGTELCGDGEITVKVTDLVGNGRAGVFMMESTAPGARRVSILKSQTRQVTTEYRASTNGSLSQKHKNRYGVDWVRIVRTGSKFKTYTSTNGSYWKHAHTITYSNFAACIETGIMVYTRTASEPVVAVFNDLDITGVYNNYAPLDAPELPKAIEVSDQKIKPQVQLDISPNPFSQQVKIAFSLTQSQAVSLAIYNLQGQLIRQFKAGTLEPGEHQNIWDGTDESGIKLPSGMYLVQLKQGEAVISRKILLQ